MTEEQAIVIIDELTSINANTEYMAGFMAVVTAFCVMFSIFSFMYMRR